MSMRPHEFAINIPKILAEARIETYQRWSWPGFLARAFKDRGITVVFAAAVAALVMALSFVLIPAGDLFGIHLRPGAFYDVVPYLAMVIGGLALFFFSIPVWLPGGARFLSETRRAVATP